MARSNISKVFREAQRSAQMDDVTLFVMVKACGKFTLTTANFKTRLIIARIDPTRTQKTKLEADLKRSGVST